MAVSFFRRQVEPVEYELINGPYHGTIISICYETTEMPQITFAVDPEEGGSPSVYVFGMVDECDGEDVPLGDPVIGYFYQI